MSLVTTFTLLSICFTAIGQSSPHFLSRSLLPSQAKSHKLQKPLTFYPDTYIDTESRYTDSAGIVVIIQNSLPKGDGYSDPSGNKFRSVIFWTRVINETATPLELTIHFPDIPLELKNEFPTIGSSASPILPSSYIHLFLPPDTMTLDKETLYNYGVTGLKSFLDSGFNITTMLERTINPNEEVLFYTGALLYQAQGTVRAGFILKEQDLFYRISGISPQLATVLIPCGHMAIKN
ncbi:MAG: hypothetical protein ABIQ21_02465 [Chryseolinea sp.]